MAKRRVAKKVAEEENCDMNGHCYCKIFSLKIAVIAFTLFLITVWPWLNGVLLSLHWGWYLGIMIVFGAGACMKNCWCCKKK